MPRRLLPLLVVLAAVACGGGRAEVAVEGVEPTPSFSAVDDRMELSEDRRAALTAAGIHDEGLLQGLPTSCRLAEPPHGSDLQAAERIVAELGPAGDRGPLVAVDVADDATMLATTLVTPDGSVGDTAVWLVTEGEPTAITAADDLAAELTSFEYAPVDTTADVPASSAYAEASDCSFALADLTHADPPAPEPWMRPDLLVLDPSTAVPGQLVAMRFPQRTDRGIAFQLDRRDDDAWLPVASMGSDGNGDQPETVLVSERGHAFADVGVGGPGPDTVRLPDGIAPGEHRICTANAGEEFCATIEIVDG